MKDKVDVPAGSLYLAQRRLTREIIDYVEGAFPNIRQALELVRRHPEKSFAQAMKETSE